MIFAFNISIALAPSFEGKITTQLASDVAKSSNLTNITISFDIIIKINHHSSNHLHYQDCFTNDISSIFN